MTNIKEFVFSDDAYQSWLFKDYYYSGSNSRYWTFQIALNLLLQRTKNPVIVETGCQRAPDDLGAGMSTSIFGRFCKETNGHVHTVDISDVALNECKRCTQSFSGVISYHLSDSLKWLRTSKIKADLIYLDSYDYPYGDILNAYGGRTDIHQAIKTVASMTQAELIAKHGDIIIPCQQHTLNEYSIAKSVGMITNKTVFLTDDNQLPGGGKPRLLKEQLLLDGWLCLFDYQQSLWIKEL